MGVELKNVQDIKVANESNQVYEVKRKEDEKFDNSIFDKGNNDDYEMKDIIKIDPEFEFYDGKEQEYHMNKHKMSELDEEAENSTHKVTKDGKTYTYVTDENGNVTGVKITSEDGDTTVEEYDYDGDGKVDATVRTKKNEDGSSSKEYDYDNDGTVDANDKETVLDDGSRLVETDFDNDGKVDKSRVKGEGDEDNPFKLPKYEQPFYRTMPNETLIIPNKRPEDIQKIELEELLINK